ncbi:enolase C-terminal domain-like protein [Deinococcus sonorensis]|uniref:Enolase C-terminal domain-like protein n=2 Tax=Deinococcus sonorensis TaxID=309891 RepID=A0AAU7U9Y8_9DEIO
MTARIVAVEAVPYRLPLHGTLAWGKGSSLSVAEHVLVRVRLDDGSLGQAEAPPRPTIYGETVGSVQSVLALLEGGLKGLEITDKAGWRRVLGSVVNNHTARGALDMALHDAAAQAAGQTLFDRFLGPQIRVQPGFILGIAAPEEMLEEARRVVAAGVRVLKVKVGRDHARDLELIRTLRQEHGDAVQLYADSNETLTPELAPAALRAMREAGLTYVEEPLPVRLLRQRQALRAQALLPIIGDDSCFTPADLERELDFGTIDILNIKTARNGFTDSLQMLTRAQQAGLGVMIGSQASTGLGTLHAALMASQAGVTEPSELSFVLKLQDDLLDRPIVFDDGWLDVAALREHRLDEGKLERYRM